MKKINLRGIAFWIMIFIIVALSIYVLYWIKTESFECLNNVPVYMIKTLEKNNKAEVSCICNVNKLNVIPVLLTRDGFQNVIKESNTEFTNTTSFNVN